MDQGVVRDELPGWMRRVGLASWYFVGFCAALSLLVFLLVLTSDLTIPLALGIVLAVIFTPLVQRLRDLNVPSTVAAIAIVVLVISVAVGSVVTIGFGLAGQGAELSIRIDSATAKLQEYATDQEIDPDFLAWVNEIVGASVGTLTAGLASGVVGVLDSAAALFTGLVLGLMVLYYLLKDGQRLVVDFVNRQPASGQERFRRIADEAAGSIQGFARGRSILAVMNGVIIGVVAAVVGVPMAFAIALVNFVGAYIPYLGGIIGGAFAFLLALSAGGLRDAILMVVVCLAVNLGLENLLEPRLLGDQLKLHPLVVLLATVLGGLAAGIVGLILAAPLTAIGVNLYREVRASGFFD